MIKEEYKFSELTSKIIGCAMTVHSALGNGFQEVIYQRALEIEMPVYYKNNQIGTRRVDFLIHVILLNFKRLTYKTFKQKNQGNPEIR
jgi:GxxExxY protein